MGGAGLWVQCTCLVALGITCTWTAAGCNNPLFADIVPSRLRSLIYALDRCFEMMLASAGGIGEESWVCLKLKRTLVTMWYGLVIWINGSQEVFFAVSRDESFIN